MTRLSKIVEETCLLARQDSHAGKNNLGSCWEPKCFIQNQTTNKNLNCNLSVFRTLAVPWWRNILPR